MASDDAGSNPPFLCLPNTQSSPRSLNFFPFSYLTLLVCVKCDEWSVWRIGPPPPHTHTESDVQQWAPGRSAGDSLSDELTGWSELWRHVVPNVVCMCGLFVCVLED